MNETAASDAGSALSRAAEQVPLPGIHDDNDETAAKPSTDESAGKAPVGQRPEDEAEEAVAFRALR